AARAAAPAAVAGGTVDAAAAVPRALAGVQRQEGLLPGPGNRVAHALPGQGEAWPGVAGGRHVAGTRQRSAGRGPRDRHRRECGGDAGAGGDAAGARRHRTIGRWKSGPRAAIAGWIGATVTVASDGRSRGKGGAPALLAERF